MSIQEVNREPNPEVVDILSNLLDRAKQGEILSVAFAYVDESDLLGGYNFWSRSRDKAAMVVLLDMCGDGVKGTIRTS